MSVVRADASFTPVMVGGRTYIIDLKKIPYFKSFTNFHQLSKCATPAHGRIPHFDAIAHAIEHGFRYFFRRMPADLEEYRSLCESLEFLAVDVIGRNYLSDIFWKVKLWPFLGGDLTVRKAAIRESRDAAFQLVYLFLMDELDPKDYGGRCSNTAFQAVEYVIKNSWFSAATRRIVWEAYTERFIPTKKQKERLEYVAIWNVNGSCTERSSSDED